MQSQMEGAEAEYNDLCERLNPPYDWSNPDFKECDNHRCIHCWRNYVSDELKLLWAGMSGKQRLILAANFDDIASSEHWD
ncbi:MAG TPA: hypothetical protein EYN67_12320 [Flavobacteriales bacterium]|nr:hypothetical protein [Flavobacteriales bacterium]